MTSIYKIGYIYYQEWAQVLFLREVSYQIVLSKRWVLEKRSQKK